MCSGSLANYRRKAKPTSGLEPLTCSLRVILLFEGPLHSGVDEPYRQDRDENDHLGEPVDI